MHKIGIIDCGMGNLTSVKNAFLTAGSDCSLITDSSEVARYEKVVLPGVGAFPFMMENLQKRGFVEPILKHIEDDKPLMGICLGMQVLFQHSFEFEKTNGLSILKGEVVKLPVGKYPVPNVGWWSLMGRYTAFSNELSEKDTFYFVHSYFCKPAKNYDTLQIEINGACALAGVRSQNVFGYQFHPEKSQKSGQKLFRSFMKL